MTTREEIAKELYKRNPQFKQTPGCPHPPYSWEALGTKELYRAQADAVLAVIQPKFDEIKKACETGKFTGDKVHKDMMFDDIITLCTLDEPKPDAKFEITLECGFCNRSETMPTNEPIELEDVKKFAEDNGFLFEDTGGFKFATTCVGCKPKGLYYKKCKLLCFGTEEQAKESNDAT